MDFLNDFLKKIGRKEVDIPDELKTYRAYEKKQCQLVYEFMTLYTELLSKIKTDIITVDKDSHVTIKGDLNDLCEAMIYFELIGDLLKNICALPWDNLFLTAKYLKKAAESVIEYDKDNVIPKPPKELLEVAADKLKNWPSTCITECAEHRELREAIQKFRTKFINENDTFSAAGVKIIREEKS